MQSEEGVFVHNETELTAWADNSVLCFLQLNFYLFR